jgi:hypothetical protein
MHESPEDLFIGGATKPPVSPPATGSTSGMPAGVRRVAEGAQQKVGPAVEEVREQGKSQLAGEEDWVAGTVGSVAHALRETGNQVKHGVDTPIAEYVDRVGDGVEQLSTRLRQRNVDERIGDTESIARRQPAFFSGGVFFLGPVAARFLKSSRPEQSMARNVHAAASTSPGAAATSRYSWQAGTQQPRPTQLPALTRPPLEPQRMVNGSSIPSNGPRSG